VLKLEGVVAGDLDAEVEVAETEGVSACLLNHWLLGPKWRD
jgi:hypothetical protein